MTRMRRCAEEIGELTVTAANHLVVGSIRALSVGGLGPNGSHDRLALEVVNVRLRWVGGLGAAGLEHVVDVKVVGVLDRCLHGRAASAVPTQAGVVVTGQTRAGCQCWHTLLGVGALWGLLVSVERELLAMYVRISSPRRNKEQVRSD